MVCLKWMIDLLWGKWLPIPCLKPIKCQMPIFRKRWKTVARRLKWRAIRSWTSLLPRDRTLALPQTMSSYLWMQVSQIKVKLRPLKRMKSWWTTLDQAAWLLEERSVMALVNSWIEWVVNWWKTYISTRLVEQAFNLPIACMSSWMRYLPIHTVRQNIEGHW